MMLGGRRWHPEMAPAQQLLSPPSTTHLTVCLPSETVSPSPSCLPCSAASLMHTYLGMPIADVEQRIRWNPDDPNLLQLNLPGGMQVRRNGAGCDAAVSLGRAALPCLKLGRQGDVLLPARLGAAARGCRACSRREYHACSRPGVGGGGDGGRARQELLCQGG